MTIAQNEVARGQGLGRCVMEALETEARTLGARTMAFGRHSNSPLSIFMGKTL